MIDTYEFARLHADDDVRRLALCRAPEGVDLRMALQQIAGRQAARRKVPAWAANDVIHYPVGLSMEQCSSQETALYKRRLVEQLPIKTHSFTDMTGGLGVDFSFIAPLFESATYVEQSHELCELARHNMQALGLCGACIVEGQAEDVLPDIQPQSLIFIDPARRNVAGAKVYAIADCQPNIVELHDMLVDKAAFVLVKLSPMLDIHDALRSLPTARQVHVVAVDGECKELLVVLSKQYGNGEAATVTAGPLTFTYEEEAQSPVAYADHIGAYLYEPSAELMKAGAFRTLAARYNIYKVQVNSHLYTSDTLVADFPGRTFTVQGVASMRQSRTLLAGVTHANVLTRNFPVRADELRRRLRLTDGGRQYVIGTTDSNNQHILIKAYR